MGAAATPQIELAQALGDLEPDTDAATRLAALARRGLDNLPLPGSGATLRRWQALAEVGACDLSLAKLYEGHTDALAILAELGYPSAPGLGGLWGVWAAESPQGRIMLESRADGRVLLRGTKYWCSGAMQLDRGLLTAWHAGRSAPQLVCVDMRQPGIRIRDTAWQAVGMAGSASVDVDFDGALGDLVGGLGDYLARPGFWHGGAGVAACWYGGARALGSALLRSLRQTPAPEARPFRLAALGKVDLALRGTAAMLREAAAWIDDHPREDAGAVALRVRLQAERCAQTVLDEAGRALGAGAFCRDARFARMAADLPVFVRQSHAERDFVQLAERLEAHHEQPWAL